ncbi:hypothetical protein GT042_30815, partial [Streptomyces sp. SID3212]|nr:hypothetical protein [Streptomyces sp. SID3212]
MTAPTVETIQTAPAAPTIQTAQTAQAAQTVRTTNRPRTPSLAAERPGPAPAALQEADLAAYFAALTAAVERDDPGPSAGAGWEERERLYVGAWVRRVYEHPLSPLVFARPPGQLAQDVQHAQAAGLALRIDVGR